VTAKNSKGIFAMQNNPQFLVKAALIFACLLLAGCKKSPSLPPGLVSWWSAEGNAADKIGNDHGTLKNGAGFGEGFLGKGFQLDGLDDYVEIPDAPSLNLRSFSVALWIYIDPRQNSSEFNAFVGKSDGASASGGFFFAHDDRNLPPGTLDALPGETTNALRFAVYEQHGERSRAFLTNAFPAAGFYFIAGTFDGAAARLYLNSSEVAKGAPIDSVNFNRYSLRFGAIYASEIYAINVSASRLRRKLRRR
jgi:hypothetical protein